MTEIFIIVIILIVAILIAGIMFLLLAFIPKGTKFVSSLLGRSIEVQSKGERLFVGIIGVFLVIIAIGSISYLMYLMGFFAKEKNSILQPTCTPCATYTPYPTFTSCPTSIPCPTSTPCVLDLNPKLSAECIPTEIWDVFPLSIEREYVYKSQSGKECYKLDDLGVFPKWYSINNTKSWGLHFDIFSNEKRTANRVLGLRTPLGEKQSMRIYLDIKKLLPAGSKAECEHGSSGKCDADFVIGVSDQWGFSSSVNQSSGRFIVFRATFQDSAILLCKLSSIYEKCVGDKVIKVKDFPDGKIAPYELDNEEWQLDIDVQSSKVIFWLNGAKVFEHPKKKYLWVGYSIRSSGDIEADVVFSSGFQEEIVK